MDGRPTPPPSAPPGDKRPFRLGRTGLSCLIPILLLALLVACNGAARENHQEGTGAGLGKGTLDLRGGTLADGPVALDGEWEFYWLRLVAPGSFREDQEEQEPPTHFSVPGFWNGQKAGDNQLQPTGYATYRLQILMPEEPGIFAVRMVDLESAYRLYANGILIGANGSPATEKNQEVPEWRPSVHTFLASGNVDLVLHVSNFHHRLGGVWQAPEFGYEEDVRKEQKRRIALDLFLSAALLAIGIYHTLIYVLRRAEKAFLLLGLFCLIMGLRSLVVGERFILELLPLDWNWLVRLDYLTVYIGAPVCHWFLFQVYRKDYNRAVVFLFIVLSGTCALVVLLFSPLVFTRIADAYHILFILISLYSTFVTIIALIRRRPYATVMLVGWVAFTVANMHDILFVQSLIESQNLFALGLLAFLFTQSYTLAGRYARALSVSEDLQERVRSLLHFTQSLNQERDGAEAVRKTLRSGAGALGTSRMQACLQKDEVYYEVEMQDAEPVRECIPRGIQVMGFQPSTVPSSSKEAETGTLYLPILKGGETLAELQWFDVARSAYEREKDFLMGLGDSLALTLDSIRSTHRATLTAIGQAASEIVHDINHHCHAILQQAEMLRRKPDAGALVADSIHRETHRLKNMAFDILDFARANIIVNVRPESLSLIRQQLEEDLEIQFQGTGIQVSVECSDEGSMPMDLPRFRRVAANLAINARMAMPSGGRFSVAIEREDDQVYFLFEDNGPGLPAEILNQLLGASGAQLPQAGQGFGLAVVGRIVRAHGGEIHVLTPAGGGTRFSIVLPGRIQGGEKTR